MWDNTSLAQKKKELGFQFPLFLSFFFFVQTETQREKCVQQDIAVQSYLR